MITHKYISTPFVLIAQQEKQYAESGDPGKAKMALIPASYNLVFWHNRGIGIMAAVIALGHFYQHYYNGYQIRRLHTASQSHAFSTATDALRMRSLGYNYRARRRLSVDPVSAAEIRDGEEVHKSCGK